MNIMESVKTGLGDTAIRWEDKTPFRHYIDIHSSAITMAAALLFIELKLRFITATGTDLRHAIEIQYHFSDDASGNLFSLRVLLDDKSALSIASLSAQIKAASWIEREIHELLGVDFKGNPNLKHLLLKDDWPAGNYPLRHDNEKK